MSYVESILGHNKELAAQQSAAGTLMPSLPRALPNVKAIIIGCADMRVDPAHVLGIKPGEAVVLRNIGGRITPGLLGTVRSARANRRSCQRDSGRRWGVSYHCASAHGLRHDSPCWRSRQAGPLFSSKGKRAQDKSGHRSSRGSCRRRCFAAGDSRIAWRMVCLRSCLRRGDWSG